MTASELAIEQAELTRLRKIQEAEARASRGETSDDETNGKNGKAKGKERETIYRDQSGAIIDIHATEQAERQKLVEEERKKQERKDWNKGLVQKQALEEKKLREKELKGKDGRRGKEDEVMNKELRERERFDDPAAAFLTVRSLFSLVSAHDTFLFP